MKYTEFKDLGLFNKYHLIDYLYNHIENFHQFGWTIHARDYEQYMEYQNNIFEIIPDFNIKKGQYYSFFITREDVVENNWSLKINKKIIIRNKNINEIIEEIKNYFINKEGLL